MVVSFGMPSPRLKRVIAGGRREARVFCALRCGNLAGSVGGGQAGAKLSIGPRFPGSSHLRHGINRFLVNLMAFTLWAFKLTVASEQQRQGKILVSICRWTFDSDSKLHEHLMFNVDGARIVHNI